jgi:hypothetical protein
MGKALIELFVSHLVKSYKLSLADAGKMEKFMVLNPKGLLVSARKVAG